MRRLGLAALCLFLVSCRVEQRADLTAEVAGTSASSSASSLPSAASAASASSDPSAPSLLQEEEPEIATPPPPPYTPPPGIPYLRENPEGIAECAGDFTIDARYAHLQFLGLFFTAWNCGPARVAQLPFVQDDFVMASDRLTLESNPSSLLRDRLKDSGYRCSQAGSPLDCTRWDRSVPISTQALAGLKAFAGEMKTDQCVKGC